MIFIKLHHYILFFICNTWEQRKLGDLLNETREKTSVEDEDTLLSCAIDGMFLNSELFSHFRGSSNIGYLKVKKNDLILSAQNLHLGNCNVNLRFEHGIISPAYKVYELINCDPLFMQAWVKQDKTKDFFLKASTEGASICRKNIVWEELYKQELPVPKINEQVKIGAFFQNLDNLITLHQRKCDDTKELKKYMLQKMFPKNGEKFPEIRFKGFTEAWEQRKLIDVCDYVDYRGKTPTKTDSGVFLVTAKNVKDGYIDYGVSQEYISEDDYEEVMHRGKPEIGDVLITTEAPCGNVAQVNRADIALAQRIIKYRGQSNIVDNTYLKDYLQSPEFQNILNAKSSGGTVKGIKGSILHQQEIKYPKYEEQFKIGSYFNNLDNLITLHQRKYSIIHNKLITWEQRKLGELAEIVGGGTPSTSVNSYWDGDIDWYAPAEIGEQIYLESSQLKITEEGLNKSSAKILPIGTVLFTSRAGIGKTAILQKEGCTNQGFQSIVPNKEKLDSYFIFTRSEELKRYGETVGAGSTFVEVSGKQMANMELMMPKTMPEQQQIGEFFANLDHLITLHRRAL